MSSSMKANANKVAEIIERYPSEARMTKHLKECAAVAFYRVYRLGCIVTARHGKGLLIAKLPKANAEDVNEEQRWSAPAAVSVSGLALAGAIGFEYTDFVMFLDTKSLYAFYDGNSLGASTNLCFAFGPFGSAAEAGGHTGSDSAMKMIGSSSGLYAGGSLEFSNLMFDRSANRAQYEIEHASAKEILTGQTAFPEDAEFTAMVRTLNRRMARNLPASPNATPKADDVHVPSAQGNENVPAQAGEEAPETQGDDVPASVPAQAGHEAPETQGDDVPASDNKHVAVLEKVSSTDAVLPKAAHEAATTVA